MRKGKSRKRRRSMKNRRIKGSQFQVVTVTTTYPTKISIT